VYAPGSEPANFFPLVLEVPNSNPQRFELIRWSEFKKQLQTNPKLKNDDNTEDGFSTRSGKRTAGI
jgi:hypothetical protein